MTFAVEAKIGSDDRLIKTEVIHRQHPLHHQFDLGLVRLSCGEQQLGMQRDVVECAKPTVGKRVTRGWVRAKSNLIYLIFFFCHPEQVG